MRHPCSNGRPAGNGWNSPVNNAKWGTDYLNRTGTAKSNMYDNRPEETKYIYTDNDSQGKQLAGENYEDPKNLTPAVAHLERTKIYPLNGEVAAKPMKFPDASGVPVNMLPISDGSAFQQLKRLVDSEGDNLAGPDWLGMLAAIGIVKDQLFAPDAHAKEILDQAAKAAYKMSRVIGFEICMATIGFSGFQWEVRAKGQGGPGPNIWDNANALVDDQGRLHLKITSHFNPDGYTEWRCVELSTLQRLGLGRYQFQVIGRIDKLDRNVVLGLFKYPTPDVGTDGTNEIDIEFAQWGRATARLVDSEGDNLAGPDWLGMLAAIGIVKDQPFAPDAHAKEILDQAAKAAYKMSRVIGFEICMATIGFSGFQWEVRAKGQGRIVLSSRLHYKATIQPIDSFGKVIR